MFTDNILDISEQIRSDIEKKEIKFKDNSFNVTISSGVSYSDTLKKSITFSNHALLYAKEHGRNNVTFYSEDIKIWFNKTWILKIIKKKHKMLLFYIYYFLCF